MMAFWIIAGAMIIVAGALIIVPLSRIGSRQAKDARAINIALWRGREAELETEYQAGLINDDQYAAAKEELETGLLDDAEADSKTPAFSNSYWQVIFIAVVLPLLSIAAYVELGFFALTEPGSVTTQASAPVAPVSGTPDFEAMIAQLEQRLQDQPADLESWAVLARSYAVLKRYGDAAKAYAEAYSQGGATDPVLLANYGEVLALSRDSDLSGAPQRLLEKSIALDPDQPKALWYLGLLAVQRGNPAGAIERWEHLQQFTPPSSEQAATLDYFLAQIRQTVGAESDAGSALVAETTAGMSVQVEVSIAPELAGQFSTDDTLFIFARRAGGPPMPLAVVRHTAAALPLTVTLDDSMAMVASNRLSSAASIVIGARISRSGQPMASSGDLQGLSQPLTLPVESNVKISIKEIIE